MQSQRLEGATYESAINKMRGDEKVRPLGLFSWMQRMSKDSRNTTATPQLLEPGIKDGLWSNSQIRTESVLLKFDSFRFHLTWDSPIRKVNFFSIWLVWAARWLQLFTIYMNMNTFFSVWIVIMDIFGGSTLYGITHSLSKFWPWPHLILDKVLKN